MRIGYVVYYKYVKKVILVNSIDITIQPLQVIQQQEWLALWQSYQRFYKVQISAEISQNTWRKLIDDQNQHVYGFAAMVDGKAVGIVHVIEHDSCWTLKPYAYLQDLYTHEGLRGKGVARALIQAVQKYTEQRQCDRVYWLTHQDNEQAQNLYDRIARKTGFIQYRI